jgi:hypothetical protein
VMILKKGESSSLSRRLSSLRDSTTHTDVIEPERTGREGERCRGGEGSEEEGGEEGVMIKEGNK